MKCGREFTPWDTRPDFALCESSHLTQQCGDWLHGSVHRSVAGRASCMPSLPLSDPVRFHPITHPLLGGCDRRQP